jgi:hypothetical protein
LRTNCTHLISSLLATKAKPVKALAASRRVRMVWWVFREFKTSERAFSIANALRRRVATATRVDYWTNAGQLLDKHWTKLDRGWTNTVLAARERGITVSKLAGCRGRRQRRSDAERHSQVPLVIMFTMSLALRGVTTTASPLNSRRTVLSHSVANILRQAEAPRCSLHAN